MNKKYVLHPGWIISEYDGDLQYITESQLATLYGVPLWQCLIYDESRPETFLGREYSNDLIHLYPSIEYRLV